MSKENDLRNANFQRSSTDANKWVNPVSGHSVKFHEGGSTTISTSRHNKYGAGMSDNFFSDRLKK